MHIPDQLTLGGNVCFWHTLITILVTLKRQKRLGYTFSGDTVIWVGRCVWKKVLQTQFSSKNVYLCLDGSIVFLDRNR